MEQNSSGGRTAADPRNSADDPCAVEALDWFVRLQAAQGDPPTVRAFRAWIESDPRNAAAFEKVASMWGAPEFLLATHNVAKTTGFSASKPKRQRRSLAKKATIAAMAIVIVVGAARFREFMIWMRADYVTATGEQQDVLLPDGSRMILNTGSAVALDFSSGRRGVKILAGEVYFDVQSDPVRSFQVTAQFGRVEVKGTAFAVRTDDEADNVIVSRGSVDVTRMSRPSEHAGLKPEETVGVTASAISPVERIDTDKSLAWIEGRISFYDRPLGQVLNDLRRYYRGRIFVANSVIERVAVSGNYKLNQPALAIQSLAEAAGATTTTLPGGFLILR